MRKNNDDMGVVIRRSWRVKASASAMCCLLAVSSYSHAEPSASPGPQVESFTSLAARCAPSIHLTTLAAVVRHESAANPYAIGINTKGVKLGRQPRTRAEAIATANLLLSRGYNFDAGLGQINSRNFGPLGLSVSDLFEPCANLKAAATVLGDCYDRASRSSGRGQAALREALSCYNTGSFSRGFANGYVRKVAAQAGVAVPPIQAEIAIPSMNDVADLPAPTSPQPASAEGREDAFGATRRDAFAGPAEPKTQAGRAFALEAAEGDAPLRLTSAEK